MKKLRICVAQLRIFVLSILKIMNMNKNSIGLYKVIASAFAMTLFGVIFIHQYSMQFTNSSLVFSSASLIAFASLSSGGIIGFLFAIPKSLDNSEIQDNPNLSETDKVQQLEAEKKIRSFVGNTNLEQISDWLTKVLVGASLTQIPDLIKAIKKLVFFLAPALTGTLESTNKVIDINISKSVTFAILVYFSLSGFLACYLWARLDLPRKLSNAITN